ncbi:MAG: class I SAM-dependent methyltransferase, partial [Promethearchaeota archaeon]
MKNQIISILWNIFNKIPNLKERLFRFYAWKIFEKVPKLKDLIYKIYDRFWFLELLIDNVQFNPLDLQKNNYKLDLGRINSVVNNYQANDISKLPNDWDFVSNLTRIEDTSEFQLIKKHFTDNADWKEINEYEYFRNILSNNKKILNCSNEQEFTIYLKKLDDLHQKLIKDKLTSLNYSYKVGVGRIGEFVLLDDIFQISIFKIIGMNKIPIEVVLRHPLWIKFSSEFLKFQSVHGELYQPLIHPDLGFKSSHTDERFYAIQNALTFKNGTLLDIGANLAYFCHKFEDLGFDCSAVEIRPSNVHFMKKLREIERKKFKIINKSIFDLNEKRFDVVLALNIFHHFLREKGLYLKLIEFLRNLDMKIMYFQPHDPNEKVMQNAYHNYNNKQFVEFIIKNSCLNEYELINKKSDSANRPIYK